MIKKIIRKLINKKKTIAVAESCTGGLLSKNITDIPGSSKIFKLGIVCYSNSSKKNLLKVPNKILKNYGAVSPEVSKILSKNLLKISKSDYAISITGIAGPSGGSIKKPIGLVYISIANKKGQKVFKFNFNKKFKREKIRSLTVKKALVLLSKNI
ncbi:MAG: CinA family protein [Pelagibacteraceae bacterium]